MLGNNFFELSEIIKLRAFIPAVRKPRKSVFSFFIYFPIGSNRCSLTILAGGQNEKSPIFIFIQI
jgi:hypothetical protein